MYYVVPKRLLLLLLLVLTACRSTAVDPVTRSGDDFYYLASLDIDASVSQAELETSYGGEAILYKPEAGFAVLGFSKEAGELTTLGTSVNANALANSEASASGHNACAGGFNA